MTQADALQQPATAHIQAINFLAKLHRQFPFAEGRIDILLAKYEGRAELVPPHLWPLSYRVHIACMLAIACGALIPPGASRLGFAYNANAPRSGKTLLAKIAIAPFQGWTMVRTWPVNDRKRTDEAEIRKVLDAVALEAAPYVLFDNVKGVVSSEALEAFITAPVWTGRYLGSTRSFSATHSAIPILTGNGLQTSTDIMARFLWCDLAVEEAEAQDRDVKEPIEENWVMDHAAEIRSAVLALVLHWVAMDKPAFTGRPRRGFEIWSNTIGAIIECAGLGDLFEKRADDAVSGSPDDAQLRQLVHEMASKLDLESRQKGFHFADIVDICHSKGLLERFLDGKEETEHGKTTLTLTAQARSRFGNFLKRYAPEKKGRIWHFPAEASYPYARTIRLMCTGHDRTREYLASVEVSPLAELQGRLHEAGCKWEHLVPILEQHGLPTRLEDLNNLMLATINAKWNDIIRPLLAPAPFDT